MIDSKLKKYGLLISSFIFFINVLIKLIYIANRDIALDEPFTIYYAQTSIRSIIEMLYNENNPPLHFLLLHFWIKSFGITAFSVRLPSVIFSSLTAVVIYKIGNKFFNQIIGLGASLIFTFSTMHIFFSHEARVYPLFCLLASASLFFYLNIISNPPLRSNYYWLLIFNILLIYSHYFGFFIIFLEVLSLFFIAQAKQIWKPLFFMLAFALLSYIPMMIIFIHRIGTSTVNGTWVAVPGITEVYGNLNRFLNNRFNTAVLILISIVSIIFLLKQKILKNKIIALYQNVYFKITFLWFIVPYLLMFFISFKYPMFIDRYILYTSIPFYLTIAIFIDHFYNNYKYSVIAIVFFIISLLFTVQLNPDNNRRLKQVTEIVSKLKKENTLTFIAPDYAYMGFCYHYNIDYFGQAPKTIELLNKENIFLINSSNSVTEIFNKKKWSLIPNCIYVQAGSEFIDPNNSIYTVIASKYKTHETIHVFEIYDIHYFHN